MNNPSQALVVDVVEGDRDRATAFELDTAALAGAGVIADVFAATVGGTELRLLFVVDAWPASAAPGSEWRRSAMR